MELRKYQSDLIDDIKQELRNGRRSVCAVLGCGGGKSVIQAMIAKSATNKGNNVLFLVHRRELCQQIANTFFKCGVDLNLCDIEMVQTVSRNLDKIQMPELIITDECHHALSKSYMKIYDLFPDTLRLGFTATPYRLGHGGLGDIFDSMVEGVTTKWLIENHYLSPYVYYGVKLVDTDKLRKRSGEYVSADIAKLMEQRYIYGEVLSSWRKFADGKKTIIYCASIESSVETVKKFTEAGIITEHLDGKTPTLKRQEVIKNFREGKITVLSNVDLFGEGFDVPDCECVVLLRPTLSRTLHIQQSMRSMRYKEGKTAVIIDHVGNVYRHGLPDDLREWTLEGKDKKESEVKVKQCPACFAVVSNNLKKCSMCGHVFSEETEKEETAEPEYIETELEVITSEDVLKNLPYSAYRDINSFENMERFRKARGYKFPWSIRKCLELGIAVPDKYKGFVRRMQNRAGA